AALARRYIGFPDPLDTPKHIIGFLFVIAPLSCLVNPSISLPVLAASGVAVPGELVFSGWTLWLSDTPCVLLRAPVVSVVFGTPRDVWRPRRLTVALPLATTAALTALVFVEISRAEDLRVRTQFLRETEYLAALV